MDNEREQCNIYILDYYITQSFYSIRSILQGHNSNKRQKMSSPLPVVSGILKVGNENGIAAIFNILLDSGASQSVIHESLVQQSKCLQVLPVSWTTVAGNFTTNKQVEITFKLPTLHEKRIVTSVVHVTSKLNTYDMIIGRDLLQELGIVLNLKENTIIWDDSITMMKGNDNSLKSVNSIENSKLLQDDTSRMKSILEAKYEAANLDEVSKSCENLTSMQQEQLKQVLQHYSTLFDGTLGHWQDEPYNIEPDVKTYHARPYPIPKANEATLKMEVERLCNYGVLRKIIDLNGDHQHL